MFTNMGHLLHIISIIIFFFLSFYFTHIFISTSSFNAQQYFNNFVPSQKELYVNGDNVEEEKQTQSLKALILGKIRLLIEFESFTSKKSRNGNYGHSSPSPAPSPSPLHSPTPAPMLHFHPHAPPPHQQLHSFPPVHKGKRDKKVLVAVLGSVGALILILCAIGLFFGYRKFKQSRRRPKRNVFTYRTESRRKGKLRFLSSQTSVKKVTSAPVPDLFYLNSIESALEPEKCCLKLNYDTGKAYINNNQSASYSGCEMREESDEKLIISEESGSVRCSSIGEITPVHEIRISSVNERVNVERIHKFSIPEEVNSSDDESFHSFCDSRSSSKRRLSNASDTIHEDISIEANAKTPILLNPQSTPPPPPPPPPLPTPSGVRMKSSIKSSFALPSTSYSPKTRVGIPPPPCPPMPKLQVNSPKVPSTPLQFNQQMPLGKDGCPLPKLKALHWDKVRAAPNRSTVWDKLRSSSFEFDEEMMESLFGYNMQNNMKSDEVKSKTPSPTKHVLEPKRLQNITILSKALNVTPEQVCGALIRGDGLSLQDLETLSKMVLTKEEEAKLSNYKGHILELSSAENLVMLLLKIPFAFARIEAMLYRESFDDEVIHLRKSFSMLEEACKELRSSRLFLKLLEAVLKTGNRMNVGTIRGEAKAFKLDTLLKLADVKGTDGKTTLLHFVVQEIIRSEGIRVSESIMGKINQKCSTSNVLKDKEENYQRMGLELVTGLTTELCNVKKTATIDSDVLASSVTNLSNGMRKLQTLVEEEMINGEYKENFVNSMRSFLIYADTMLRELKEDENRVVLHVREITEYFHGNVSKDESNPLRIFVIVRDFLNMLDHVCKELKSLKGQRSGNNPLAPFR